MEHSHANHKPPSQKQLRIIWFALTALAVLAIIIVIAAFVWGFGELLNLLSPVLWPLAIAAVLAYLLDPAVNWLQRHKISRVWAIVIVFVAGLGIVGGVMASVIPQMVNEANRLVTQIPTYTEHVQQKVVNWANNADKAEAQQEKTNSTAATTSVPSAKTNSPRIRSPRSSQNAEIETQTNFQTNSASENNSSTNSIATSTHIHKQILTSAQNWLGQAVPKIGNWLLNLLGKATVLIDVAIALILIPIYTFYFLREKREIKNQWTKYLPIRDSRIKDELVFILTSVNQYMVAFFRGQVMVALISGTLYTIGFVCIGLDYAFLLGFLAVILVIIPFIGAIILCIISVIVTTVQFSDFFHPAMVLVLFALVQSLESFFYSPRIMGNRVNLHPVVVIIALMIGITLLGGLLGGILAIPLAAALRVLLFRYVWKNNEAAPKKI